MNKYLSIAPEIREALAADKPIVALESTILSHGMPYPENLEFSHKVEEIVREEGAIPATTAIIDGKMCIRDSTIAVCIIRANFNQSALL